MKFPPCKAFHPHQSLRAILKFTISKVSTLFHRARQCTTTYTSWSWSCASRWSACGSGLSCKPSAGPNLAVSAYLQRNNSIAYMKLLLRKEIPIMNIQLGMMPKAQKTYPRGTARPYWANKPSNGWKSPWYGSCSLYCFAAWSSTNV